VDFFDTDWNGFQLNFFELEFLLHSPRLRFCSTKSSEVEFVQKTPRQSTFDEIKEKNQRQKSSVKLREINRKTEKNIHFCGVCVCCVSGVPICDESCVKRGNSAKLS